ncbi:uncharacterized protein LOC144571914 [Carex rostrata]
MADAMISNEDPCLVDSGTTNTILKSKKYFSQLYLGETNIHTISGTREEKQKLDKQVSWNSSLSYLDPRSGQCELEVQKIINMQRIANELPDAFTDTNRVTKSHIPAINAPARIDITKISNESNVRRKRGRPLGSKDVNPRKRKEQNKAVGPTPEEVDGKTPAEVNKTPEEVDSKTPEKVYKIP